MKFFLAVVSMIVVCLSRSINGCNRRKPTPPPPPPPECTSIYSDESRSADMAPLFGDVSGTAGEAYIVVLDTSMDPEAVKGTIDEMPRTNRRIFRPNSKVLSAVNSGVKSVLSYLDSDQLKKVRKLNGVKYVEKDSMVKLAGRSDTTVVWGLDRIDQRGKELNSDYSPNGNGSGVVVYVVDSGVNTDHVKFNRRAVKWYDAIDTVNGEDCTGHGTHVAGIVAAMTYGVAIGTNIRSVRVFGCSDETQVSTIVKGINYILEPGNEKGVVTLSISGAISNALDDAVKQLIREDFVVVVAAGNEDRNACGYSPGRVIEAITVGATDRDDRRISVSNFGTGVDIFAPGDGITSLSISSNTAVAIKTGTSMAVPHVAGAAAILLSQDIQAGQVRSTIYERSTRNVVVDAAGSHNRLLYVE